MPRVTLLSDFGTRDGYVGVMKGVLATRDPGVLLDDIAHDIPRGDIRKAARVLGRVWRAYPEGTVHLVVVDPGVGTRRRGLALAHSGHFFVAPDNGVLTPILDPGGAWEAVELTRPPPLPGMRSRTFHGRDLFAPAAALLATGHSLRELGPPLRDPLRLSLPQLPAEPGTLTGEVVEVDRFGNLATSLNPRDVEASGGLILEGMEIPFRATYGQVAPGEPVVVINSDGLVEVAVRDGSAEARLGLGPGSPLRIREE